MTALDAEPRSADADPPGERIAGEAATHRSARDRWRTVRWPALIALAMIAVGIAAAITGSTPQGTLDPRAFDKSGSHAAATLLGDRGVRIDRTLSSKELVAAGDRGGKRETLLIADVTTVSEASLRELRRLDAPSRIVVLNPTPNALADLGGRIEVADSTTADKAKPGCALPAATIAGPVTLTGETYTGSSSGAVEQRCYGGKLVTGKTGGGASLVILADDSVPTNGELDKPGVAALAEGVLGDVDANGELRTTRITWLVKAENDVGSGGDGLLNLLPGWVLPALLGLALAGVVAALTQGRRLGPVVAEPLPVVVRSAETVEGRARLYRRARARDRAAGALAEAARARIRSVLGLGAYADEDSLLRAVAASTGRSAERVGTVLHPPPPSDDSALVRLADELDALTATVRAAATHLDAPAENIDDTAVPREPRHRNQRGTT